MALSEIRHLKPVSKDMKYLVENGGHRRSVDCLFIASIWWLLLEYQSTLPFGNHLPDLLRLFKGCAFNHLWPTDDIHVSKSFFAFPSIRNVRFPLNAFRRFPTFGVYAKLNSVVVLQPKYLDVCSDCDFCDDDIFAENYSGTELRKCSVPEGTLRRILEDSLI
uniref:PAP-associated domain-containing protein n=1 Tax=Heterorhabditis bacteriophora TaxID=37862 RepID=A0A1I7WR58_HETBA